MARTRLGAALLLVAAAGVSGCSTQARFVQKDPGGGVVAVPQSSMFQWYYRNDAIAYIREYVPDFTEADIIEEGEVPVGKQTRVDQRTGKQQLDQDGKPVGDVTTNSTVTSTSDLKEYRITYKLKAKQPSNMDPNGKLIPAGAIGSSNGNNNSPNGVVSAGGMQPRPATPTSSLPANVDARTGQPSQSFPGANISR